MARRILRIYPPYLCAVLFTAVVAWSCQHWWVDKTWDLGRMIRTATLTQNYPPASGQFLSNPALWTIPVEMEFYLLYPLVFWAWTRFGSIVVGFCLFTVYPSLFEGCGLPILESLTRGKPCLCGENGALGEVARGGGCLTVKEQHNPDNLASGMRRLLEDANLRQKLKEEASARDFGTWQDYASALLSFFSR